MKAWTMEWAWVPLGATPMRRDTPTLELKSAPPMRAARDPALAPRSCARRMPNSSTTPPRAASRMRAALVATRVW